MQSLVTTDWLAGELGSPGLVIFDATKYLPNSLKPMSRAPGISTSTKSPIPTLTCRTWSPPPAASPN